MLTPSMPSCLSCQPHHPRVTEAQQLRPQRSPNKSSTQGRKIAVKQVPHTRTQQNTGTVRQRMSRESPRASTYRHTSGLTLLPLPSIPA